MEKVDLLRMLEESVKSVKDATLLEQTAWTGIQHARAAVHKAEQALETAKLVESAARCNWELAGLNKASMIEASSRLQTQLSEAEAEESKNEDKNPS